MVARMTAHPDSTAQPAQPTAQELRTAAEQRWAAWASVIGGSLAAVLTSGVLTGAVLASYNALGDVGLAAHIPDLPVWGLHVLAVALDGLAGVALLTLLVLQPGKELRTYCWTLVGGCIAISMLANGAHAVFDNDHGRIVLPVLVAFGISTVPAASAACALHLILKIGQRLIEMVRTLVAPPPAQERAPDAPPATAQADPDAGAQPDSPEPPPAAPPAARSRRPPVPDATHPAVLDALRTGRGYRTVVGKTHWSRGRAQDALEAARAAAQGAHLEVRTAQDEPTFRDEPGGTGQGVAA
jgi:hypothetical protein